MIILALDTCLNACQAAVTRDGVALAVLTEPMQRGHQERLGPMVQEAVAQAGIRFADIDRIAVTVGPGSFTGLRVGLAFAKGLKLALGVPTIGIGTLEALAASAGEGGPAAAVIDGRRGQIYLQTFQDGVALSGPRTVSPDEARAEVEGQPKTMVVGPGAGLFPALDGHPLEYADPLAIARLGEREGGDASLTPIYLRAPDAKPQAARVGLG